jgi:hypothetical protein
MLMGENLVSTANRDVLHLICDRDVGLFALILSVVAHVHWATGEGRIPIVYYSNGSIYWTRNGYRGRDTVWEYYFEPVVPTHPASVIPAEIREQLVTKPLPYNTYGYFADEFTFVSNHQTGPTRFNRENIKGMAVDPSLKLRKFTSDIIRDYVRPRDYINQKVNRFFDQHLARRYAVGVHIRGTDALVDQRRWLKLDRIDFQRYFEIIDRLVHEHPDAVIFVASDSQSSVERIRERFGERVVAYDAIRHNSGDLAGKGPTGRIMPAYLNDTPDTGARSGEEAVIEYLLLCRCNHLVHNGSGMARTVLLTVPEITFSKAIPTTVLWRIAFSRWRKTWQRPLGFAYNAVSGAPIMNWYRLLRDMVTEKRRRWDDKTYKRDRVPGGSNNK